MTRRRSYKTLLNEARQLRSEGGKSAYRRAQLLTEVFENSEFRDEIGARDDYQVCEVLDDYVEDLCLSFLQLQAMLKEFPQESDWADGRIKTLYGKVLERAEQRQAEDKQQRSVKRVTKKEFEQLEQEKKDAEFQAQRARERAESAESKIERLENENRELRVENARLSGRLEELERIVTDRHETAVA